MPYEHKYSFSVYFPESVHMRTHTLKGGGTEEKHYCYTTTTVDQSVRQFSGAGTQGLLAVAEWMEFNNAIANK